MAVSTAVLSDCDLTRYDSQMPSSCMSASSPYMHPNTEMSYELEWNKCIASSSDRISVHAKRLVAFRSMLCTQRCECPDGVAAAILNQRAGDDFQGLKATSFVRSTGPSH
eukprot:TRINITY_DN9112_c0_g1_i3.p4 TRINITY_DN9112_c0_g1~~TRINITY_DN9112_c0_g1_i3.p4  ORF type:complete len:110 (-),score=11.75 TRINITY_DN9112_c0_g1_i3:1534-1863(-)